MSWPGLVDLLDPEWPSAPLYVAEDDDPVAYDEAFGPRLRTRRRPAWAPASDACEVDEDLEGVLVALAAQEMAAAHVKAFNRAVEERYLRELEAKERRELMYASERERRERARKSEVARRRREREEEARRLARAEDRRYGLRRGGWRGPTKAETAERRLLEAEATRRKAERAAEVAARAAEEAARAAERARLAGAPAPRSRNRYAGPCAMCGLQVAAGDGLLVVPEEGRDWGVRHPTLADCREEWRRTAEPVRVPT